MSSLNDAGRSFMAFRHGFRPVGQKLRGANLTDFLLARAADGAAQVEDPHAFWHNSPALRADVAAVAGIAELHVPHQGDVVTADGERPAKACAECLDEDYPCRTIRLLALKYVDRPGYREEWRP